MYVIYDNKYVDCFDYLSRFCIFILVVDIPRKGNFDRG